MELLSRSNWRQPTSIPSKSHEDPTNDQPQLDSSSRCSWYAVQVRPRRETLVAEILASKGYELFLPLVMRKSSSPAPGANRSFPLFPGYLFCALDLADRSAPVVTTPGVIRLVGNGSRPMPIARQEIESLRKIVTSSYEIETCPLQMGHKVTIVDGPLRGVEGIVCSIKNAARLVVNVTLLHRAVSIQIDRTCVLPLTDPGGPYPDLQRHAAGSGFGVYRPQNASTFVLTHDSDAPGASSGGQ